METGLVKAVKVFFCYADKDETLRIQLEKHLSPLRRLKKITGWFNRDIDAGTDWAHEIETRIDEASIILLLVSPDFIHTDYCYSREMEQALSRHKAGDAYVIPIIMRPVQWEDTPIGELKVLPTGGKPITQWSNRDAAFLDVVEGIRELVRTLLSKQALSSQETTILYPEQVTLAQDQSLLSVQRSLISTEPSNESTTINPATSPSKQSFTPPITMSYQIGREVMLADNQRLVHLLLEIRTAASETIAREAKIRLPLNVALVLSHSRSMKGTKLKSAKETVKMVLDRLEPTDYVSVVIFDDTSQVLIPSMLANDKYEMKHAIDRIRDAGGTAMSLGMIQGLQELRRHNFPNTVKRMLLLTDGVTDGDSERCRQLAKDAVVAGISIYPLGFGSEENRALLSSIGALSNGSRAHFIHNLSDVNGVLQMIIDQHPQQIFGVGDVHNVTLTLHMPMGVSLNQAIKILPLLLELDLPEISSRSVAFQLSDLQKESLLLILVDLIVDPRPIGFYRIAQAAISYDVPTTGAVDEKVMLNIRTNYS